MTPMGWIPSLKEAVLLESGRSATNGVAAMNHFLETWGYLAIFVLTVLESACIPIPSEVTLGLSGALASGAVISGVHGDLSLGWVIVVGIIGSLVGSLLAYWVGRTGGRAFIDRFGRYVLLTHRDLDRAEAWFRRQGDWAVLVGRVVPVVRTFISLPAGLAEMNLAKFTGFTAIGVAAWVSVLCVIGYEVGAGWHSVTKGFSYASYAVAVLVVVAVVLFVVVRLRSLRKERDRGAKGDQAAPKARS